MHYDQYYKYYSVELFTQNKYITQQYRYCIIPIEINIVVYLYLDAFRKVLKWLGVSY